MAPPLLVRLVHHAEGKSLVAYKNTSHTLHTEGLIVSYEDVVSSLVNFPDNIAVYVVSLGFRGAIFGLGQRRNPATKGH